DVLHLTGDDLQRAIALSLEESSRAFRETGITDEEQAITSIAENKASLKRTHTEVWSDSPNPHDRKRQENCPVGLKNVGNTCWFSAVIQSLFNLLEFQRLVLHYSPNTPVDLFVCAILQEHRYLPFMRELRHLFSLMVGSKRKYVDPSRAVEILKDAFKSSDSQQQDVSEFTHKLLDWLEDAFQLKPKNPMVELFYGRFLAVGVLEGKKFENSEMFGQYPLQVNGFKDLHECLEAAMIEGEIESLHSENCAKSGQEHWFTELPPVLTFELSRFEFNQALGRPEKIHNKLEFPSLLYMDRYMDRNRDITRIKREEIRRLKEHLTLLQQRLESAADQGPSNATEPQQRVAVHKPFTQSRLPPDLPMHPAPRHITEEELRVLEGCLQRWRTEVENDTRDLQASISRIHRTMELMYSDKSMMQVPYRLHAVLVHEGQANAGHYWAYIHDPHHRCWMKYNDVSVTKSSWEELVRDSFGGYRNASAYCLMYINGKKPFLIEGERCHLASPALSGLDKLPADLKEYVMEDNQLFDKELEEWDAMQARKARQETPATAMLTPNMQGVIMAIGKAGSVYDKSGPEAAFFKAFKVEYARLLRLAQEDTAPENDRRLQHAIVYFLHNQAPKRILERTLLMQFADRNLGFDERCRSVMKVARAKLDLINPDELNMEEYEMWHQDYRNFRETTIFLMIGLELFQKRSYVEALRYLVYCYQYNKELLSKGLYRGHDEELIAHYRRECLLKLNEHAASLFESGDESEVNTGLGIMNELVVPCLPLLLADEAEERDMAAVEDMRNRWCSYLGQEMESHLQEKLTDFLPKLLDCSTEVRSFHDPPKLPSYSTLELCERFGRVMASLSRTPADGR
uniref:Ubiquitin carboxyl-terminal hydrolase n=1 Tax=Scleropages formosus TaxID=113540 RepID=A0A8D0CC36_SCLFO